MFILPKKYISVNDVRLRDVIEAFPDGNQYYLRFEQVIIGPNQKRIRVWFDVKPTDEISVPNVEGRIRIKALKIPFGLQLTKQQSHASK
jgi:hypothetical protein